MVVERLADLVGDVFGRTRVDRAQTAAVARFVHLALSADLPPGWLTGPGHLRHHAD